MKRLVLVFKILLGIVPFLPLFVDAIFKTNIRVSIMNMTMQWSLLIKVPILGDCQFFCVNKSFRLIDSLTVF